MAEPVYRMRGLLNEMENGDLSWLVGDLRKKDEFKHLFADINKVKERWRLQVQDLQLTCRELGKNGSQEQHLKRIKEIVSLFKM